MGLMMRGKIKLQVPFLDGVSRRFWAYLISTTVLVSAGLGFGINKLVNNADEKPESASSLISLFTSKAHSPIKKLRVINDITEKTIKGFEQLRLFAYDDKTKKTLLPGEKPVGVITIGWGHTGGVKAGDSCTVEEADRLFAEDIKTACTTVSEQVRVPLTDNQYGALVCFVYNVGSGAFSKSTLLKNLNAGNHKSVPYELIKWSKQGSTLLPGLVRRRIAEAYLYVAPELGDRTPIEKILKSDKTLLDACTQALTTGQPFSSIFAEKMKSLPFAAPRDQWWLDYINGAALRSFFNLMGETRQGGIAKDAQSFNFNALSGVYDAKRLSREVFGNNKQMRQVFEYIQLAHMEKNLGTDNMLYNAHLLQYAIDGNPYLNIKYDDIQKGMKQAGGKKNPLQVMNDLVAVNAPWLRGEVPKSTVSFGNGNDTKPA